MDEIEKIRLQQAIDFLIALNQPTRHDHKTALLSLESSSNDPNFAITLLHLFKGSTTSEFTLTIELRLLSAMIIKNYICKRLIKYPIEAQSLIKQGILLTLNDYDTNIQNTAATLVGSLVKYLPIELWIDILPYLFNNMQYDTTNANTTTTSNHIILGSLKAIKILCEDSTDIICTINNGEIFKTLITLLLSLLSHNNTHISIKLNTLYSINFILAILPTIDNTDLTNLNLNSQLSIPETSHYTTDNMINISILFYTLLAQYLQLISHLATDTNIDIRCAVCKSVLLLTTTYGETDTYTTLFPSICIFMLHSVNDNNENVAMEACEFWSMCIEEERFQTVIIEYILQLIPILIIRLRLSEAQLLQERADAEAEATGEKRLQFKPIHHRTSSSNGGHNSDQNDDNGGGHNYDQELELSSQWTIRKECALLLDCISINYKPNIILSVALPVIESQLKCSDDVWAREAAMLALG